MPLAVACRVWGKSLRGVEGVKNNIGVGVGVGVAIGTAIGVAMHNLAVGIAIGVALGAAFSLVPKKGKRASN
jgi:zinc transporter ZupT